MTQLAIPRFTARPHGNTLPSALVAAIRYDYEYALLSQAEVCRKYRFAISAAAARRVMDGEQQPDVKAQRHALAWCKFKKENTK